MEGTAVVADDVDGARLGLTIGNTNGYALRHSQHESELYPKYETIDHTSPDLIITAINHPECIPVRVA